MVKGVFALIIAFLVVIALLLSLAGTALLIAKFVVGAGLSAGIIVAAAVAGARSAEQRDAAEMLKAKR
jgi:hypothetical protein